MRISYLLWVIFAAVLLCSGGAYAQADDDTPLVSAAEFDPQIMTRPDIPVELPRTPPSLDNYWRDDEFSEEEKDEEALYIYALCDANYIHRQYYDCACISGAFRAARETNETEQYAPLLTRLYNNPETQCVNKVGLAGKTYLECIEDSKIMRSRNSSESNEQYCSCLANGTVREFSADPSLNLRFMRNAYVDAALACRQRFPEVK